jgi:all-trans-8'-apo-beta-carotenal 15,15'-oxygenase
MIINSKVKYDRGWSKAVLFPGVEFNLTKLKVLEGQVPRGLRGSLYRNGPGRLGRGGQRVGHWFDGDGAVLAVHFTEDGVFGTYRFVETQGFLNEQLHGRLIYAGYGMVPPGLFWTRFGKPLKNTANTSILAFEDRVLALWEQGHPYALHPINLETIGIDNLGSLQKNLPFSAHPKKDPDTGDIYNFGVKYGIRGSKILLYKCNKEGRLENIKHFFIGRQSMVHDFTIAGPYMIFIIPPLELDTLPFLLNLKSYSEALKWKPQQGTQFLIFNRYTFAIESVFDFDPFFFWHIGNSYFLEKYGIISIDLPIYRDFTTNKHLTEMSTGSTNTAAPGLLYRLHINPKKGKIIGITKLLNRICEFPIVPEKDIGYESKHLFMSIHQNGADIGSEWFSAIGRYDYDDDFLDEAYFGEDCYVASPTHAEDVFNSTHSWLLTIVYNNFSFRSEVWIFDALSLNKGAVCKLMLPEVIPIGYHGAWKSESTTFYKLN